MLMDSLPVNAETTASIQLVVAPRRQLLDIGGWLVSVPAGVYEVQQLAGGDGKIAVTIISK